MKAKTTIFIILLCIIFGPSLIGKKMVDVSATTALKTFWKYQCIDTMKTSRDRARNIPKEGNPRAFIANELNIIRDLGANCVSIGTPYDDEFIPFMKLWVEEARKRNLSVWFRGNFSEWEGWFDYKKKMTPEEHLRRSEEFVFKYKDLFQDGDAFDPCPECEGYGPWKVPDDNLKYLSYRQSQEEMLKRVFASIGKKVIVNRLSTIGGRAKEVYDAKTIKALDNVVTIDHYVKDTEGMESYIKYFRDNFGAKTFVGEFGAPNPDINGKMTEDEQAAFIKSMYEVYYKYRNDVEGVNYWVLAEGTTRLVEGDYKLRKAALVIRRFYKPGFISGRVVDTLGRPISDASIDIGNGSIVLNSDTKGVFETPVLSGTIPLLIRKVGFGPVTQTLVINEAQTYQITLKLSPTKKDFSYKIKEILGSIHLPRL